MLTAHWVLQCNHAAWLQQVWIVTKDHPQGAVETSSALLLCAMFATHIPAAPQTGPEERAQHGGPGVCLAHVLACRHTLHIFVHAGSDTVLLTWE